MMNTPAPHHLQASVRKRALAIFFLLLGMAVAVEGLMHVPERIWPNLLVDAFYLVSLSVSGLFIGSVWRLTGARWAAGLRRIPEGLSLMILPASVLLLLVFLGKETLYPWARPGAFAHDPAIAGRASYLQPNLLLGRQVGVFALWIVFAWLMRRLSVSQDRNPGLALGKHHALNRASAVFVVLFAPTFTLTAYDWILSLDPRWSSTMFAVYIFAGTFVQGIAAVTLGVVLLAERGFLPRVATTRQLHDLGKLLLAFSIFWAYIWVCQYLLIWYGNMPEEVSHYVKRTNGPWLVVFGLNFVINWVVPFGTLLSVRTKTNPRILKAVCVLILAGRWLDLYVQVMPAGWAAPHFGVFEVGLFAGTAALAYLIIMRNLSRAPLVPVSDPVLAADLPTTSPAHA
jgi:hypothetical protein